jgi:rubrerythrin
VTEGLRRLAGEAWAFRTRVEQDAARRFARLAAAIAEFDSRSPVIPLLQRAADDEKRHAALCSELASAYGQPPALAGEEAPIAPASLGRRQSVLYEIVAACCITETESVATLTTLLAQEAEPQVERTLREIARDEVAHGRMGWAHLAREAEQYDVSFLSPLIPAMLAGTAEDDLFRASDPALDSPALLRHGVLPHSTKREVFAGTLEGVVFPGLEKFGIDAGPARAWLKTKSAQP